MKIETGKLIMVKYRFLRASFYPEFTASKAAVLCVYSTRKTNKQKRLPPLQDSTSITPAR